MKRIIAGAIFLALSVAKALAQQFPATMPPSTFYCRSAIGTGPGQACPFSLLPAFTFGVQPANKFLAGPTSGGPAAPTFRALAVGDVLAAILPAGVPTNTPNAITAATALTSANCSQKTYAGGTAYYVVTVNAASGYTAACLLTIVNTDTLRGKTVSVSGGSSCYLSAGQQATISNDGGTWVSVCPGRYIVTATLTLFVDKDTGNDSNDCLAAAAGACATPGRAETYAATRYDKQADIKIKYGCTTPPCTYTDLKISTQIGVGSGTVIYEGDTTTPDNVVNTTTAGAGPFTINPFAGNRTIQGFKLTSTSATAASIQCTGPAAAISFSAIDFGSNNAGAKIGAIAGCNVQSAGNYTISGGGTVFADCEDVADCHFITGVGTLTGSPAFSTAFLYAHGGGAIIGTVNTAFSGAAAGGTKQCSADLQALIDTAGTSASLPGTVACTASTGAYIN